MSVMSHDLMQCHKADEEIWEMGGGGGMRKKTGSADKFRKVQATKYIM